MKKISVVVPVYNCEEYLPQCVDSILKQTYPALEVILIDDGSTDQSIEICDSYGMKDDRVKVVHQKNAGAAATRNKGIELATGDFLTFVDSDDWIDADMYEQMVETIENNDCDIAICDCVKEKGSSSALYTHQLPYGLYSRTENNLDQYYDQLLISKDFEYSNMVSSYLLLIDLNKIPRQKLSYPENIRYSEDLFFGARLGLLANKVFYLKGYAPYHYRIHSGSVTQEKAKRWPVLLKLYYLICDEFLNEQKYDFTNQVYRTLLFFLCTGVAELKSHTTYLGYRKSLSALLEQKDIHEGLTKLDIFELQVTPKQKLIFMAYKFRSFRWFLYLLWMRDKKKVNHD